MSHKTEELVPVRVTEPMDVENRRFSRHKVYADVSRGKMYYETWKRREIPPSEQDRYHLVEAGEEGLRGITLIAYKYYNRVDLWWVIALANGIFCPTTELVAGVELRIPSQQSLTDILL